MKNILLFYIIYVNMMVCLEDIGDLLTESNGHQEDQNNAHDDHHLRKGEGNLSLIYMRIHDIHSARKSKL